ncbi:DUF3710 domain-containing protein [Pseudarthrobacter sp. PS3-L1]|uniref:DUF3710 domain-containing protein n=1 Tax=Pseudarthrobacter sp. PS3-L1 TaxID=3046207 RepID=UPI0024B97869|nr:DUF3710 domain-containing protein [Pseudarthrobacter sp. PS3-L1]MDJ0320324.1 DUF3710 domain-containing protein [Pseudarthrobacter sp. PS3-L1]
MVFGRGKKAKQNQSDKSGVSPAELDAPQDTADPVGSDAPVGPFDFADIDSTDGYVDLGALLIAPSEGLQLRLEIEEATQRVIAVTLDLNGSSLQLQAFAAPKTEGLWDEIRVQIGQSVGGQGGQIDDVEGSFGTELIAKLPATTADGSQGYRVARFVGVDGPRWFLRGVFGGPAALEADAAKDLEALFRQVVVLRGDSPMPPRDLLQLRLPKEAAQSPVPGAVPPGAGAQQAAPAAAPELRKPERGPETTQIG